MNRTLFLKVLASTCFSLPLAYGQWGPQNGSNQQDQPSQQRQWQNNHRSSQTNTDVGGADVWFTQSFPQGAQAINKGSPGSSGLWETGFNGASTPLKVSGNDELFCWVQIDPNNPPKEIMLSWNDGSSWEHRAYWGQNTITYGKEGTPGRMNAGQIPSGQGDGNGYGNNSGNGDWVKLAIPASNVGLNHAAVTGMTVSVQGGQAQFGAVGAEPQGIGQNGPGPMGQSEVASQNSGQRGPQGYFPGDTPNGRYRHSQPSNDPYQQGNDQNGSRYNPYDRSDPSQNDRYNNGPDQYNDRGNPRYQYNSRRSDDRDYPPPSPPDDSPDNGRR